MIMKTDAGQAGQFINGSPAVPALVLDGIGKRYVRRKLLRRSVNTITESLRDVSFTLHEGETLGLLGPNGAGKTTLLKIISTLLYPSSGRVTLFGRNIVDHPIWARRNMGLVTCDERSFYARLTGRQNLSFFSCMYGIPANLAEKRIEELLDTLGMAEAAQRQYQSYSSGMKQKMAIARGLLSDPRIALYDEPTRSLDPLSAQNIRNWIQENRHRWPRQARILATNQLREAEVICDRILILNKGRVIAHGTVQEIRERWEKRDYAMHRITCAPSGAKVEFRPDTATGLLSVEEDAGAPDARTFRVCTRKNGTALSGVLARLIERGLNVVRCETEQTPFDEVFCSLVMSESETRE